MNTRQIPEPDWKAWRRRSQAALERYCARVLDEAAKYSAGAASAHERYLELYRYIHESNRVIALIFDDLRRSTAFIAMSNAVARNIVSWEEMEELTPETQGAIRSILE